MLPAAPCRGRNCTFRVYRWMLGCRQSSLSVVWATAPFAASVDTESEHTILHTLSWRPFRNVCTWMETFFFLVLSDSLGLPHEWKREFAGTKVNAWWCDLTQAREGHVVRVWIKAPVYCRVWQEEERGRGEVEARERERSGKSLSSLLSLCHTLWPLSVTISLCWPWASGGWRSASPSSIHLSLFQLTPTYTSTFSLPHSQPPIIFVYAKGVFVMLSSSLPSITATSASLVILVMSLETKLNPQTLKINTIKVQVTWVYL